MSTPFLRGQNLLGNSRMSFWQRGTSAVSVSDTYQADRFRYSASPALVADYTRNADVPTTQADFSLNIGRASLITPAATEGGRLFQGIEGNIFKQIRGKKFTLFFWAKSSKIGPRYVTVRNSVNNRYFLQRYEITSANTWQSFQFQLTHDETGSWLYDSGLGLDLSWTLLQGSSNVLGTAGSWQSGAFFAAPDQVNTFDAANSYFRLALPMIVPGHVVLDPLNLPLAKHDSDLSFCQRYFQKSYNIDVPVGTATSAGSVLWASANPNPGGTNMYFYFKTRMRSQPLVNVYSSLNGAVNFMQNASNATNLAAGPNNISESGAAGSNGAAALDGNIYNFQWTADAEF